MTLDTLISTKASTGDTSITMLKENISFNNRVY